MSFGPDCHGFGTVTTAGTLSAVDVRKAWAALPERYRANATWLMLQSTNNQIRAMGSTTSLADFTVNLAAAGTSVLTGKPVLVIDYAPNFTDTTGAASIAVVGDMSNFVFADRAGMTVELVPHLFGGGHAGPAYRPAGANRQQTARSRRREPVRRSPDREYLATLDGGSAL